MSSPDQLNMAVIENKPISENQTEQIPSNFKRKSEELTNCPMSFKKRLYDQNDGSESPTTNRLSNKWSMNETEFFHTQFFKQIDKETAAAKNVSQYDKLCNQNQLDCSLEYNSIDNTQQRKKLIKSLNLTQMFCDDDVEDNFPLMDQKVLEHKVPTGTIDMQSSQLFFNDIKNVNIMVEPIIQLPDITDHVIYESTTNASAYIEKQRSMLTENEYNLNDDNFLDSDLSQAYKSSQYRRELEEIFDACEKTICKDVTDENEEIPSEKSVQSKIEVHSKSQVDVSAHNNTLLREIENMNWSQPFITPTKCNVLKKKSPLVTPTSIVQQRLTELTRRNVDAAHPIASTSKVGNELVAVPLHAVRSITTSTFKRMGPFFGLPLKVKQLIQDFKGISDLYGTHYNFTFWN